MITIRFRDGMFCPVAICDECKSEITNAGAAMYAWFAQDDSVDSDMFTLHKDCSRLFEEKNRHLARNRYPWIMWEEMSNLPWALASNTGCNPIEKIENQKYEIEIRRYSSTTLRGDTSLREVPKFTYDPSVYVNFKRDNSDQWRIRVGRGNDWIRGSSLLDVIRRVTG